MTTKRMPPLSLVAVSMVVDETLSADVTPSQSPREDSAGLLRSCLRLCCTWVVMTDLTLSALFGAVGRQCNHAGGGENLLFRAVVPRMQPCGKPNTARDTRSDLSRFP